LIILTGATASGKSSLSLPLAERLGAEIACMDSMQVYRGMDVGTAKPTAQDRARVPHHLLDLVAPTENFSTASWLSCAEKVIRSCAERGKRLLFCGGTGLYMKALLDGLFHAPRVDPALRDELIQEGTRLGAAFLHRDLSEVDPEAAEAIHPNDLRRIVRALEVYRQTGVPISELRKGAGTSALRGRSIVFCIHREKPDLEQRIADRTRWMFENGLVEEARHLLDAGCTQSNTAMQGLGYRECVEHLKGRITREESEALVTQNTRRYAKRQGTWFRKEHDTIWVFWQPDERLDSVLDRVLERVLRVGSV